jgi:translation elongation factor EF-1beta
MGKKEVSVSVDGTGATRKQLEEVFKRLKQLTGRIGFGVIALSAECTIRDTRSNWGEFRQSMRKYLSSLQV